MWSRAVAHDVLVLGVLVAIGGAFAPSAVLATAGCATGLALVCGFSGLLAASGRTVIVTVGAVAVAFVLCFPWSLTFVQPGANASVFFGVQRAGASVADLAALSRFALGPIGHSPLAYGLLVASGFVLFVAGTQRFAWGARFWGAGVVALGVAWAAGEGFLAPGGGSGRILVTPVAVCVAAAVGLGVASLEGDVTEARFGWRHAASAAFVVVGVLGILPVLGESPGGRWELPQTGYDAELSGIAGSKGGLAPGRVLWLGAPEAVPGNGWQLRPGFEAMLTASLLPNATAIYPSANPGTARLIGGAVADAELGRTVELGTMLAREQVAAIVVPSAVRAATARRRLHAGDGASARRPRRRPPEPTGPAGTAERRRRGRLREHRADIAVAASACTCRRVAGAEGFDTGGPARPRRGRRTCGVVRDRRGRMVLAPPRGARAPPPRRTDLPGARTGT